MVESASPHSGRIFISYSHRDKFAARLFELWLAQAGYQPLRDDSTFRPARVPNEIKRMIASCDLFLGLLSSNFYESAWTTFELGHASALDKPILFVAIEDNAIPREPYADELPLALSVSPASTWFGRLVDAVRSRVQLLHSQQDSLDQWFSNHYGSNEHVMRAVEYEHLAYRRLHVWSTVELASNLQGWTEETIKASDDGAYRPEPEARGIAHDHEESDAGGSNLSLSSFREDLTDEPYLQLVVRRIHHGIVRAAADSFADLYRFHIPRRHLFDSAGLPFPHSIVVHLALVTEDGYLVVGHRSARPRFYENCWSATYEEHWRLDEDGMSPFRAATRGLKEELVGADARLDSVHVRYFSLFREFDHWTNEERSESFWDINIGLAGLVRVPWTIEAVFRSWLNEAPDSREFRHLVGVPYAAPVLLQLLENRSFDPTAFGHELRVPEGVNVGFPDFVGKPRWRRQHPTNAIRLIRCLTYDFPNAVGSFG